MKKILLLFAVFALISCADSDKHLYQRAELLCKYIPDHELLEQSQDYLTSDFYALLDTMFNHLPEYEEVEHEWLYYFVTGNGGAIVNYEVVSVSKTDDTHALAIINVRQVWDDGSFDPNSDIEQHRLYMDRVNGQWLMSDFDEHKADCIRYIAISRREQSIRKTIAQYLVNQIGPLYLQGDVCVPTIMVVAEDSLQIWCDCWVEWYNISADSLMFVSGGNHSGCFTLTEQNGTLNVASFDQTLDGSAFLPSAKRIFGQHYDIYNNIHSNPAIRDACRELQMREYINKPLK